MAVSSECNVPGCNFALKMLKIICAMHFELKLKITINKYVDPF